MDQSGRSAPAPAARGGGAGYLSDRQICALAAAGIAVLMVYGGVLPFPLAWVDGAGDAVRSGRLPAIGWDSPSRADLFVNVVLGASLGFGMMGALGPGGSPAAHGLSLLLVVATTALLGTLVELLQTFSPERYSSWGDVTNQCLGAAAGGLSWVLVGPSIMKTARNALDTRASSLLAARLLQLYVPAYLFVQLATLDVVTDDAALPSLRLRLFGHDLAIGLVAARVFAGHLVLNIPIGALAALAWVKGNRPRRTARALLLGVAIVLLMEVAQILVWSRHARAADVLAGGVGVSIGLALARWWAQRDAGPPRPRVRIWEPVFLGAAALWILVLMGQYWYPFDFRLTPGFLIERVPHIKKVPFSAYYPGYATVPLAGLSEIVSRILLGIPLGLLLRMSWVDRAGRSPVASAASVAFGLMILVWIEVGQVFLPSRFPDVTDVLLGTLGVLLGAGAGSALSLRQSGSAAEPGPHGREAEQTLTIH